MGAIAVGRGLLVGGTALLYILFAWGAFSQKGWAWWIGLVAALMNGLLVFSVVMQGESIVQSLVWTVVPMILLCYLFSPPGRQALKG